MGDSDTVGFRSERCGRVQQWGDNVLPEKRALGFWNPCESLMIEFRLYHFTPSLTLPPREEQHFTIS